MNRVMGATKNVMHISSAWIIYFQIKDIFKIAESSLDMLDFSIYVYFYFYIVFNISGSGVILF